MIRSIAIALGIVAVLACWPLAAALLGVGLLVTAGAGRGLGR